MGLRKCPDCGTEVSTEAPACPKCARPNAKDGAAKPSKAGGVVGLILVIGVAVVIFSHSGGGTSATSSSTDVAPVDLNSAAALDQRYDSDATVYCGTGADDYLRSIAKYDFKWDEMGFLDSKFDKYITTVKASGVLTLATRKAALQNGFGAYEHIDLRCDYDTQAKKVLGYSEVNGE